MASENGWEPAHAGPEILEWVTVPGTNVNLQLMKGPPSKTLRAWAADWNAYIEPLRDADSAGFTPTNSVATSNHLNGTAVDLNWDSHPFHVRGTLNASQMVVLREMLDFYEDTVFWAGDWDDPIDEMHSQMGYGSWNNPHTQDFIDRKIRADGFSTFRRDNVPVPPPAPPPLSRAERYALLIIAEGRRLGITERGIKIALAVGLVETNLTNYANSNDPPSLDLPHDAVGSDHMSSGWAQQQPNWGSLQCRMDISCAATLFFTCDNGPGTRGLTKIRERIIGDDGQKHDGALYDYNDISHSPGFYAQKVQGSAFPDRYDKRFAEAEDLYNRLAGTVIPPTQGEDELSAEAERMIREMYDEYRSNRLGPTRSFFGTDGQGIETPLGFLWNIDANVWNQQITWGYLFGVKRAEEFVNRVAQAGVAPDSWAGKLTDAQGNWLAEFGQEWCRGLIALRSAMQKAFQSAGTTIAAPAIAPAAPVERVVYVDRPAPAPVVAAPQQAVATQNGSSDDTTGQIIGRAYDALQALRLADALPIEDRAPLAALIQVLSTKNGSQL